MTRTRAELRELIRQELGDEVRISGTATSGSKTTVVDTAALTQADDYWNGRRIYITSTTNGLAPQGETRKVADFANSTKTLTLEMAFSAAVEAGDVYQIAIWPDSVYNALISAAIAAYSKYRPYRSTGSLATVSGTRYYDPPTEVDLRAGHRIDEIRYISAVTQEDYAITGWAPDRHQNKIDLGCFANESRTLTVFYVVPHADFAGDSDTITIPDQDEHLIVKYVQAQFYLLMSREGFDEFGNLTPAKWTRGNVSEETGAGRQNMKALYDSIIAEWLAALKDGGMIFTTSQKPVLENGCRRLITGPAVEKEMTYIDRISAIQVTVVRRSQSQDANGDYGAASSTTLFSNIVADIQPLSGKLARTESGFNPETTHLMFLQQNLAGIEAMDIVQHGTKEYEVLVPADWREHDEFQLRAL